MALNKKLVISLSSVRHQRKRKKEKQRKRKREKDKKRKREKGKKRKREKEKKEKKRKKRKRQTLEMASEGPQRITGKYYGVYLPS